MFSAGFLQCFHKVFASIYPIYPLSSHKTRCCVSRHNFTCTISVTFAGWVVAVDVDHKLFDAINPTLDVLEDLCLFASLTGFLACTLYASTHDLI